MGKSRVNAVARAKRRSHSVARVDLAAWLLVTLIGAAAGGCTTGGASLQTGPSAPQRSESQGSPARSLVPAAAGAGWPVAILPSYDRVETQFAFSADGGLFAARSGEITAYDARGRMRPGWPIPSPVDPPIRGIVLAPDGSLLVAGDHEITDVSLAGQVTAGWPIRLVGLFGGLWVGIDSIVVAQQPGSGSAGTLTGLTLARPEHVTWTTRIPGGPAEAPVFGPNGTFYLPVSGGDPATSTIVAISPRGAMQLGYPIPWWSGGLAVAPDGAPVVWSYDTTGNGAIVGVRRMHLARLGKDGRLVSGWPQLIDGPVSAPAVAADGTMYLVRGDPYGPATGGILALDPSGQAPTGWPIRLPAGCTGAGQGGAATDLPVAQAPVVDPRGRIYVEATCGRRTMVLTYEQSGKLIVGGPDVVPVEATVGGLGTGVPGGPRHDLALGATGLAFVFIHEDAGQSSLVALDGGRLAAGWPVTTVAAARPIALHPTADGGLVVVYVDPGTAQLAATRFLATGATPSGR